MAKKRTKKQKIKAQLRQQEQFTWKPALNQAKEAVSKIQVNPDNQEKKLIIKDLWKTVWVAVILGVILGMAVIWLKLGSGGLSGFFGGMAFGQK